MKFPDHKCSLILTHNGHLDYYMSVADAIQDGNFGCKDEDWISEEQKQKAIDTNDCWTLQWYPHTPVGFNLMSAADLDLLLKAACDE